MDKEILLKIGLEVHCQLTSLRTKLFCSCSSDYRGKEPNSFICEVCMGLPGSLPVLNKNAIHSAAKIALALNCKIPPLTNFFRKNYFYPDMPKNFQITQYDKAGGKPIASDGWLETEEGRVSIKRIQLEEDPGKLNYEGTIVSSPVTLVDYNRAGIALTEIVTEPDLKTPKHARNFLNKLRSILEEIGVCDGGLEGAMRADANISLRGGKRVEVKNISSFREVERALNFEITRQRTMPSRGVMETRHWDDVRRVTVSLRVKEEEEDYRYFPEPDLVPITITEDFLSNLRKEIPELPDKRRERFVDEMGISAEIAKIITSEKDLADFFEEAAKVADSPKLIAGWLSTDVSGYLNREGMQLKELNLSPKDLAELSAHVGRDELSEATARSLLMKSMRSGKRLTDLLQSESVFISEGEVEAALTRVFEKNQEAVSDALQNPKAVNFLIGQVMKETQGRAEHSAVRMAIEEKLLSMRGKVTNQSTFRSAS